MGSIRLGTALFLLLFSAVAAFGAFAIFQISGMPQFTTQVFNCSGFALSGGTSGNCGVGGNYSGGTGSFANVGTTGGSTPTLSGTAAILMPASCNHCALSLVYQGAQVNAQKFQSTFTFLANGWNISLVVNNVTNQPGFNGDFFSSGAGCEGGIFQGFNVSAPPNDLFAVMYDQYSGLTAAAGSFTDSGVQIYAGISPPNAPNGPGQSPCNPDLGNNIPSGYTYVGVNKISTSPVHMNSPQNATFQTGCSPVGSLPTGCDPSTSGVATGDTYSVTVTYDGSNVTSDMFDVTAGGTCTPVTSGTCSHVVWTGINIPSLIGSNTGWIGLNTSTADPDATIPLTIYTWTYYTP